MAAGLFLLLLAGCRHRIPDAPPDFPGDRVALESLRTTVHALVDAPSNLRRIDAAEARARFLLPRAAIRREWIDWFSLQDNVVVEIPGETNRLIYLVAHMDKTDANWLKVVSLLVNGLLDEPIGFSFFSEGALDNGSGVAVVLEAARALGPMRHTVRVLLTGAEESGLRGARAHAARLPNDEWERLDAVINVDSVGKRGEKTCVIKDEADYRLRRAAKEVAEAEQLGVAEESMPLVAAADHSPFAQTNFFLDLGRGALFNMLGAVLPQRSWFTRNHHAPVVSFASCNLIDVGDGIASLVALPVGQLHGPRDNATVIDPVRLYEAFRLTVGVAKKLDEAPTSPER